MGTPAISVAIPTLSRVRFLRACLESVFGQTLLPREVVITDDGNDPATLELVEGFQALHPAVQVRYTPNHPPLGLAGNRRLALQLTSGELVAMLDDDDLWFPTFLETTSRMLQEHPEAGFCATDHWVVDEAGNRLLHESNELSWRSGRQGMATGIYRDVLQRALTTNPFALQFTLFRREALVRIGFIPSFAGIVPDLALFLALGAEGVVAAYVAERMGHYRAHTGQASGNRIRLAQSSAACVKGFHDTYRVEGDIFRLAARRYQTAVLEAAIAQIESGDRRGGLAALSSLFAMGFVVPPLRRLGGLAARLAGVYRPRRARA